MGGLQSLLIESVRDSAARREDVAEKDDAVRAEAAEGLRAQRRKEEIVNKRRCLGGKQRAEAAEGLRVWGRETDFVIRCRCLGR